MQSGLLDRFGYFDPTDGGESHRYALSFDVAKPLGDWHLEANVYALDYQLDLFSNFTYALDSENGDQFEQFDDRDAYGVHGELLRDTEFGGMKGQLKVGLESRFDDIGKVGLYLTDDRARLTTIREDAVERLGRRQHHEPQALVRVRSVVRNGVCDAEFLAHVRRRPRLVARPFQ